MSSAVYVDFVWRVKGTHEYDKCYLLIHDRVLMTWPLSSTPEVADADI